MWAGVTIFWENGHFDKIIVISVKNEWIGGETVVFKGVVQTVPLSVHCSPTIMALRYTENIRLCMCIKGSPDFDEREKNAHHFSTMPWIHIVLPSVVFYTAQ